MKQQIFLLHAVVAVVVLWAASSVAARQGPEPVFRSQSDLVVLHVTVIDGRSDAVPGLPQSAFRVLEEGVAQEITFFSSEEMPVAVGLILDGSASMIARHRLSVAGAAAFARSSRPSDEMFTIVFNEQVRFGLPDGVPFTSLPSLLQASVLRYRAAGMTALYDAVIAGLDHLEQATAQKRVLVVLSDGEDNASRRTEREMIERTRRSNAIVYTVSNANRWTGMGGDDGVLRTLARVGGGVAYFPNSEEQLMERFDHIAGNIRRGYTIGYVPPAASRPQEGYRHVKVVVESPDRRRLSIRSRDGYWAEGDSSPR